MCYLAPIELSIYLNLYLLVWHSQLSLLIMIAEQKFLLIFAKTSVYFKTANDDYDTGVTDQWGLGFTLKKLYLVAFIIYINSILAFIITYFGRNFLAQVTRNTMHYFQVCYTLLFLILIQLATAKK